MNCAQSNSEVKAVVIAFFFSDLSFGIIWFIFKQDSFLFRSMSRFQKCDNGKGMVSVGNASTFTHHQNVYKVTSKIVGLTQYWTAILKYPNFDRFYSQSAVFGIFTKRVQLEMN